ncbi:MAG: nicotinate-nucleotide diphosphorylase (carboxylating), partial [Atopobiaceae bacterium]|nr:nicotinate-nucleotide diphosphorylase (carboxylating) [Atopobiaceae bacterium]
MNPITLKLQAEPLVRMALQEDITSEDVSTASVMPEPARGEVQLIAKQDGVICGLDVFALAFELLDPTAQLHATVADGDEVICGQVLATVEADVRALLSAERVAL